MAHRCTRSGVPAGTLCRRLGGWVRSAVVPQSPIVVQGRSTLEHGAAPDEAELVERSTTSSSAEVHAAAEPERGAAADASEVVRSTTLPDGRVLELRPLGPEHLDGVVALYGHLGEDDLQRRFFSVFHPNRAFLEHWTRLAERGGEGLVAIVSDPDDPSRAELVAEAGYLPLPAGNAELAMTVAEGWRGWLGPYLLDALVERAAASGVTSLEAEVLATNGPMLGLLRARGAAAAGHPDWTTLRLVIGTRERVPSWPPQHPRPRLLVEGAGLRWAGEEAARTAGYDVISCPGPGRDPRRCPLLDGRSCPLVEGADAVMVVVRAGPDALGGRLLERMVDEPPPVPVVVEVQEPGGAPRDAPADSRVFEGCTPSAALLAAIDEALGH
jgi:hypothetical protein